VSVQAKRVVGTVLVTGVVLAAIALYIALYLTNVPGSVAAANTPAGAQLYLATVPQAEASDAHNTWVSYYAVDARAGNWRHDTTFEVPAHAVVRVTIYQYDTASGLRNPFMSQVSGTLGGVMTLDGGLTRTIPEGEASHGFTIPELGLSVPLPAVEEGAKNPCEQAPCSLANAHRTVSFEFRTPGKGLYRWQCFVPCAAGFITGFGGPMQTVGYMDGYIKVV
jgi:hypothetical protein